MRVLSRFCSHWLPLLIFVHLQDTIMMRCSRTSFSVVKWKIGYSPEVEAAAEDEAAEAMYAVCQAAECRSDATFTVPLPSQ